MSEQELAPVIIKKIKKGGDHGHHGGAWKVAYADFVTAMMAFFLLMWLLNATTEVQRKGIADYFHPTIPVNRISGGGDGAFGGDSIFSENSLSQSGTGASQRYPTEDVASSGDTGHDESPSEGAVGKETEDLKGLEEDFLGKAGESMASEDIARHIVTKVTDEGLIVELFDHLEEPLFEPGTTDPTPVMVELVDMVGQVFALARNEVAVNGFISAEPVMVTETLVWDLSASRAETVRQMLEAGALPTGRTQRVSGYADRRPIVSNPMSARNNRIEIILLREVK